MPRCLQQEADPRVWLKMDATAGPSSIQFGFTDPRLTTQGGLIVWPHGPRQVGFRTARGGTPPSLIDHRHGLSSQRHHLAISGRSGTADVGAFGEIALPQKRPGECQAETVSWEPSCWLRHLPLELRCSLVRGLKHEPQRGLRLALTSSCERILHAIAFLLTESFRLRR